MDHEIKLREDHLTEDVFVEHHHNQYLIFDDLRVLPNSPGNTIKLLNQFGYNDLTNVIEISEKVGLNQVVVLSCRLFNLPLISLYERVHRTKNIEV